VLGLVGETVLRGQQSRSAAHGGRYSPMSESVSQHAVDDDAPEPEEMAVGHVLDVLDVVADEYGVDQDDLLLATWSKVRKRGATDE